MFRQPFTHHKKLFLSLFFTMVMLTGQLPAMAKGGGLPPSPSNIENPLVMTLVVIIIILLLAIGLLSYVVRGAMDIYREKHLHTMAETPEVKEDSGRMEKRPGGTGAYPAVMMVLMLMSSSLAVLADTPQAVSEAVSVGGTGFGGLSTLAFSLLVAVICIEVLVLFALLYHLNVLLGIERKKKAVAIETPRKPSVSLWAKLNSFKPVEQEMDIDLGHSYDGIRELDNRLPPWWLYGFYLTIIFSVIYLWRFHVSHTAPSTIEEYAMEMKVADEQKQAYLKKTANNVDENTVTLMTADNDLAAGKSIFQSMCFACHGKAGEGGVGPNLTDEYWLHGGDIKQVFKTIKYGVAEKGMRSWKDEFSPVQMAQLASFIKSIQGTNPPNAKEKQGELFKDEQKNAGADSGSSKTAARVAAK